MSSGVRSRGYLRVLAEPRFRVLFGSTVLSIAAQTLRILALSVLVFAATGSALLAALAFGSGFLPQVFGAALLGSLADRVRPRPLIAVGNLFECVTGLALALGHLPVWGDLLLVAIGAVVTPVCLGGSGRLVAEVLTGDDYVLGRSLNSMAASAAQLAGLAGGGLAIGVLGAQGALLISAGAYFVATAWVRFGLPDLPKPAPADGSLVRHSIAGHRALLADPVIRALLLAQWLPPALVTGAESLLVPYAAGRGYPASAGGLLLACLPVGMLVGDVVAARLLAPATRERLLVAFVVLLGAPLVLLAAPLPPTIAGVALVCSGAGFAYGLSVQRRFRDAVPPDRRGQAFGLLSTGLMTCQGLGPALCGGLSTVVAAPVLIAAAGVATVLMGLTMRRLATSSAS
ncbi:MFS transporter [Labedaea rhizosphaerae]|uniref:MFS transporter n=1 Tax=Labedaea rhizosphaerae TaxID=598644 RepID=A0A4R6SPJ9_LABRH|nr:MFS transporter [Labedaea rhizosphaerae]TDQ05964.1 MFS transporter [Labedaea rhizosphaerae]